MSMRSLVPNRTSLAVLVAIALVAIGLMVNVVQRAVQSPAPVAPPVTAQAPSLQKTLPNGTTVRTLPDGTVHSTLPDGTVVSRKDGYSVSLHIQVLDK
jgi:hypothetical protein